MGHAQIPRLGNVKSARIRAVLINNRCTPTLLYPEVPVAEIKIEEKSRSWMPWLLGAIVVAALVWFVSSRNDPASNMAGRTGTLDTASAAGTLAPSRDSAMMRRDTMTVPPPR